jgi:limonene-1,2-epoxide hydrolase
MASNDIAQRFVAALQQLEGGAGADALGKLYAAGAKVGNTAVATVYDGPDGAREFWSSYRASFETIESAFRHVVADGEVVALEWSSRGRLRDGQPIEYEGVTILEVRDGEISRSTAYFDPRQIAVKLPQST